MYVFKYIYVYLNNKVSTSKYCTIIIIQFSKCIFLDLKKKHLCTTATKLFQLKPSEPLSYYVKNYIYLYYIRIGKYYCSITYINYCKHLVLSFKN